MKIILCGLLVLIMIPIVFSASFFKPEAPPGVSQGKVQEMINTTACLINGTCVIAVLNVSELNVVNTTYVNYNVTGGITVHGQVNFYNYTSCDRLTTTDSGYLVCSDMVPWLYTNGSNADDTIYFKNASAEYINVSQNLTTNNLCIESICISTWDDVLMIKEENITVTTSGGTGTEQSIGCCSDSQVFQVAVFPETGSTTYRFNANSTDTNEAVDTNRILHTGTWIVAHTGSVVLGEQTITYLITNASNDEDFTVRIRWW